MLKMPIDQLLVIHDANGRPLQDLTSVEAPVDNDAVHPLTPVIDAALVMEHLLH